MFDVKDRRPLVGGVIAAGACLAGTLALSNPGDYEARQLLEATLPTIRFLCSAMITASATILALMLTLLGLSFSTEHRLSGDHYRRIRRIARYDSVSLVGALLFLVMLSMPVAESENFPTGWFEGLYYAVLGTASLLAGWLSAIVFMLYDTISTSSKSPASGARTTRWSPANPAAGPARVRTSAVRRPRSLRPHPRRAPGPPAPPPSTTRPPRG